MVPIRRLVHDQPRRARDRVAQVSALLVMADRPKSWHTTDDDRDYDPHKIFAKSTDGHGHSSSVRVVNIQPELLHAVGAWLASGRAPKGYRTVNDLVRDALYHRLKFWEDELAAGYEVEFSEAAALLETEQRLEWMHARRKVIVQNEDLYKLAINERNVPMLGVVGDACRKYGEIFGQPWKEELDRLAGQAEEQAKSLRALRRT